MLRFEPATITVKRGTPVRLALTSTGALEHDWVVGNLDGKKVQVHAGPKASATVEFTPTAAGHVLACREQASLRSERSIG